MGAFSTSDLTHAGIRYLGFLDSDGLFTKINPFTNAPPPFLGGYYAFATGVNNAAQVVGISSLGGHGEDGLLYQQGVLTSIDAPDHRLTEFRGINDSGQILGVGDLGPAPDTIFLYSNATFTPITPGITVGPVYGGPFPANPSPGSDINDAGQIVGTVYAHPFDTETEGFLYANGATSTIQFPGATSTSVTGINNAGQIVGSFVDQNGNSKGFVATPVPEPASLLLCVSGAFAIAILKRRRKHV